VIDKRTTKVGFVSLGCPKNLVDSEVMLGTLASQGYSITSDKQDADIIVVNTCGFIDSAKKESIDTILEMAELKNSGNCKKLVVAGCLAERYRSDIREQIPEIDFVFGPDELGRILEAVRLDENESIPEVSIDALYNSREVPTIPRVLTTPSYMAYLKVSEGCDHVCTFCAIPGFRGKFRSRTVSDLVAEARRLAEQGVRELVIVDGIWQRHWACERYYGVATRTRESGRPPLGAIPVLLSQYSFRTTDTACRGRRTAV
jgi:ribosomal protein S12 methylthiotransferase